MTSVAKPAGSPVDTMEQQIVDGEIDTTESSARYLAYLARIRPVLQPMTRYLAYTSDVGESVRPIVNPKMVTGAYGVSWAYLVGDVAYEGYKARLRANEHCPEAVSTVVGLNVAKRAIFQSVASMLFPSLTIHAIVRYTAIAVKKANVKRIAVRRWLPSALGLGFIPALPFIFDEPVEHVVEAGFDRLEARLYPDANSGVRRALKSIEEHEKHAKPKQVVIAGPEAKVV
ncbi:BZ3500_MvSof-1268-A1-R1_Chr6-2g08602 [Microbotryum saponariae]|uniref:Mitochondrial fission process protein 1 n=1 Tax=Microbotryum saponariae TaxID=289078 RepID=A0A2X0LL66_9BASI|nr:BZ3500_MvSof-1268-A1-R1_Chr6-2g08602 [Microbotryum saponariae]SDA07874.1 BZ3501_MvSof-1269-A2-R1_Chr6-1g08311 [Microbotryum saponariae]